MHSWCRAMTGLAGQRVPCSAFLLTEPDFACSQGRYILGIFLQQQAGRPVTQNKHAPEYDAKLQGEEHAQDLECAGNCSAEDTYGIMCMFSTNVDSCVA